MTTPADRRDGPTLRVVGTCEGCRWLLTGVRDPALIGRHSACVHPTRNDGGTIFARSSEAPTTPEWCPRLAEARAALGREMVGEAVSAEEAEEAVTRKRSDDACEPDPFAVDAAFDADCETCSGHRFISDPDRPSGYRKCLNCNGSGKR